ncbi:hypothetical protein MKW94_028092 [Papaver nudicaule]|uniref:MLO-like protein n=1 Tax=Papaver nudicaule TaxID=74823 RepID=A0AA41SMN6_PAPNU|nr:hypothetical protein [Papaver nudicaule]
MAGGGGGGEVDANSLKYTPTWIVALVCSIIVFIALVVERLLHSLGKYLKRNNQNPLFEALQKIKEELMLLGFISLLLTVFQNTISKICVHESWTKHLLPCKKPEELKKTAHVGFISGIGRKLLSSAGNNEYCTNKGKVPLLSTEALHHLHIFIFVLAIVHVTFCVLTILFGGIKIRIWKHWEDSIAKDKYDTTMHLNRVTHVHQHAFIKDRFLICGRDSEILSWLLSFFKQFYGSVTKSDYITLRQGFIMTHCRGNPKFDFHKYMVRALEGDFKKVVGISWYLWIFVVIFLLLNVEGWHTYFWIAFIPLVVIGYIIPRLVIGVFVQVLCSYSTLPLYATLPLSSAAHILMGRMGQQQETTQETAKEGGDIALIDRQHDEGNHINHFSTSLSCIGDDRVLHYM